MSCQNCYKNNAKSFKKATCVFDSRRSLVLFLLNVVLNIEEIWEKYCFCDKCVVPCLVCQFRISYLHDEYAIFGNSFNLQFLANFQDHMHKNLKKLLLKTGSHFTCELINKKFFDVHEDWFIGKFENYYLPQRLQVFENNKIKDIKNNDFKIVLDLESFFVGKMKN